MNPIVKAWRAADLRVKRLIMNFGTSYGSIGYFFRGTAYNYTDFVGDGTENSAVAACLAWIGRTFPEAPVRVMRPQGDDYEAIPGHPLVELIERPNPYYSGPVLWMATLASYHADGNAYWIKERSAAGQLAALWYTPHTLIEPVSESETDFIQFYRYTVAGEELRLDPRDVVHFRNGLDPSDPRRGLSALRTALREVFADDEAANFFGALMRNMGIPGVLIAPDTDNAIVSPEDADAIRTDFQNRFTGDGRGAPLVMPARTRVEMLSFSPEQMNLRDLRRLPEERISAVLGIPAVVAGLGAGLDRSTFANYAEAREAAWEDSILPTQRIIAADLKSQLLPEFGETEGLRVDFDTSAVRVLQPDQTALWTRSLDAMEKGAITVAEARRTMGFVADAAHEVYLISGERKAVKALDELIALEPEPESEPEPAMLPPPSVMAETLLADDEDEEDERPRLRLAAGTGG